ncbi:MAG: hypothetical protein M1820_000474 [Bogoriella megaspora]|nr:MAG: hypothetical protein M1820_000474 [Bogoriella megaspora]
MDKQNAPNSTASPSADNSGAIAHPTSTPSPEDASSAPASSKGGISPGGAAAATFFPAVLLGVALTFLGLWLWRKRKDKRAKKPTELRHSDSLSVTTRNISDPIYDPRYGNRTDFLSNPNSGGSSNYSAQNSANNPFATGALPPGNDTRSPRTPGTSTSDRVRSIFSKSPKDPPPPIMTQRHQSGETIDVLMPPPASYGNGDDAGGLNVGQRNTTFTSMMEQAGFKQSDLIGGQASKGSSPEYRSNPYALSPESGSPARAPGVSPRSRYV